MRLSETTGFTSLPQSQVLFERYLIDAFVMPELAVLTTSERLVLLVFARHARGDGTIEWPSFKRVGEFVNLHASTVSKCFDTLVEMGLIITGEDDPRIVLPVLWHNVVGTDDPKPPPKRFTPPTEEEVEEYLQQLRAQKKPVNFTATEFVAHYQAKGWMIGKSKMKDWKAAVRTWLRNRTQWGDGLDPIENELKDLR